MTQPNPYARHVVEIEGITWPNDRTECPHENWQWMDVDGQQLLVCQGCGLDGT